MNELMHLCLVVVVDRENSRVSCKRAFSSLGCYVTQVMEIYRAVSLASHFCRDLPQGLTQDLAVHHHLPSINGEIRIVEAPVELFSRSGLIRRVVVRRQVLVGETVSCVDS